MLRTMVDFEINYNERGLRNGLNNSKKGIKINF